MLWTGLGGDDKLENPAALLLILLEYEIWLFGDGMLLICGAGKTSEVSISITDRGRRLNALMISPAINPQ